MAFDKYILGAQICGDIFKNISGVLPHASRRAWYDAN